MKIYTKKGDTGTTSLIGGKLVSKYDDRIEAYGTLDELNSFLGLIRDLSTDEYVNNIIIEIQEKIFIAESILASDTNIDDKLPKLFEYDVFKLEQEIDTMEESLPPIKNFILPGGSVLVSYCHVARTICRRAERKTLKLFMNQPNIISGWLVLKYLNRLSDFLFVLSRKIAQDLNVVETPWIPKY
jgi:cob(I)alamin adenosyltransferase